MEAFLAIVLTVLMGLAFWLFTGEPIGFGSTSSEAPLVFDTAAAARGAQVAADVGCQACHTTDGTPGTGPTWKGLAGSSRPLESGETVVADDTYLTLSVVDPLAQIVAGFDPVMPATYAEQLTESEVADLVEYLKSLAS